MHLTALGVWCGTLVGAGITAAVTFPTMRDLAPTLGAYPNYTGEHWMLGAGRVAGRVFWITDTVQFVCAMLTVVGFGLAFVGRGHARRSWMMFLRALGTGAAFLLVSWHLLILAPSMDRDLRAYWDAAATGQNEVAETHRAAFSERHPTASRTIGATAVVTLATLALGAWSLAVRAERGDTP